MKTPLLLMSAAGLGVLAWNVFADPLESNYLPLPKTSRAFGLAAPDTTAAIPHPQVPLTTVSPDRKSVV